MTLPGRKISEQTKRAMRYHAQGMTVLQAAVKAGIYPSTLSRALKRKERK